MVLIPVVDASLERMLRATLPLTTEQGDISFEAPSSSWSAQVNRLTVNLFLYGVNRSAQPPRSIAPRVTADGKQQTRHPLPMVQFSYLVSAWAGSDRDQHELLGDVLVRLIAHQVLPPDYLTHQLSSNVQLAVAGDDVNRPREVWTALNGTLRASFTLIVTVAADAYDWETQAPQVEGVSPSVVPVPPVEARQP